jgi:hypothetical protein
MEKQFRLIREFEREEYLRENSPMIAKDTDLDLVSKYLDRKGIGCIHCGKEINLRKYKVEIATQVPRIYTKYEKIKRAKLEKSNPEAFKKLKEEEFKYSNEPLEYIVCPNAPECDGTIIDWVSMDFINYHPEV